MLRVCTEQTRSIDGGEIIFGLTRVHSISILEYGCIIKLCPPHDPQSVTRAAYRDGGGTDPVANIMISPLDERARLYTCIDFDFSH